MEIGKELTQSELLALLQSFPSTLEVQYMIDAALEQKFSNNNNNNQDRCNAYDALGSHKVDTEKRSESLEINDLTPSRSTSVSREMHHHAHESTFASLSPKQDTSSVLTNVNGYSNATFALVEEHHELECTSPLHLLSENKEESWQSSPPPTQLIKSSNNNVPSKKMYEQSAPQLILSPSSCEFEHFTNSVAANMNSTSVSNNTVVLKKCTRTSDKCDREWQELLIKTTIEELINERLPALIKEQVNNEVKKQLMEALSSSSVREQLELTYSRKQQMQQHKQMPIEMFSSPLAHRPPLAPTRTQNFLNLYSFHSTFDNNICYNNKENTSADNVEQERNCVKREGDNDGEQYNVLENNLINELNEEDERENQMYENGHFVKEEYHTEKLDRQEEVCLSPVTTLIITDNNIARITDDNSKCLFYSELQTLTPCLTSSNSKTIREKKMNWGLSVMDVPWFVLQNFGALRDVYSQRKCGAVKVIAIAPNSPFHIQQSIKTNDNREIKYTTINSNVNAPEPCIEVNDVILAVNSISVSSCNVLETILSQR